MWAARRGSVPNIRALIGHAYAQHFKGKQAGPIDTSRLVDVDLIKKVCQEAGKASRGGGDKDEGDDEVK